MIDPDKWYSEYSNVYQTLKKLREKMIKNGYTCADIRENNGTKDARRWVFDYQRERAEDAFKPLPSNPVGYQ